MFALRISRVMLGIVREKRKSGEVVYRPHKSVHGGGLGFGVLDMQETTMSGDFHQMKFVVLVT